MAEVFTTDEAQTAENFRQEQLQEYGTYVAKEPIRINGVLAFNTGDPVPVSHVKAYPSLKDVVESAKVDDKATRKPATA